MQIRIMFWNTGFRPETSEDVFGCATLGYFDGKTWAEPDDPRPVTWRSVEGRARGGTFEEMLDFARRSAIPPKAIVVFLTGNAGNDAFVRALTELYPEVPVLGGASAQGGGMPGQVLPEGRDGALLLVDEEGWRVEGRAIHRALPIDLRILDAETRLLRRVEADGQSMTAKAYFDGLRRRFGRPENDFESITIQTLQGKNIHCSAAEGCAIAAGSDIEGDALRTVEIPREEAQNAIADFMREEGALSVGCAGLKSLLTQPIEGAAGNVGVFLFGEIVPVGNGASRFANLMLGKAESGGI